MRAGGRNVHMHYSRGLYIESAAWSSAKSGVEWRAGWATELEMGALGQKQNGLPRIGRGRTLRTSGSGARSGLETGRAVSLAKSERVSRGGRKQKRSTPPTGDSSHARSRRRCDPGPPLRVPARGSSRQTVTCGLAIAGAEAPPTRTPATPPTSLPPTSLPPPTPVTPPMLLPPPTPPPPPTAGTGAAAEVLLAAVATDAAAPVVSPCPTDRGTCPRPAAPGPPCSWAGGCTNPPCPSFATRTGMAEAGTRPGTRSRLGARSR